MDTVEICYDRERAIYWCTGYLLLGFLSAFFVVISVVMTVSALRPNQYGFAVLTVALFIGCCVGTWASLREARKQWKWFHNTSVILTFTADTLRDRRPPHNEVRWLDIRAYRLQTVLTKGLLTTAYVEIHVARGSGTVSVIVPILGLDQDPERIFYLMERYIFVATRRATAADADGPS